MHVFMEPTEDESKTLPLKLKLGIAGSLVEWAKVDY